MVTVTPLLIELSQPSGIPVPIQFSSLTYITPSPLPKETPREDPPISHLWKGICQFFNGIFKPCEKSSLEQKARKTEEENIALRERLAEKEERLKRMERVVERRLDRGVNRVHEVLTAHAERSHVEKMSVLEFLGALFQRHEVAVSEGLQYKQGYEAIVQKYNTLEEQYESVLQEKEELAEHKNAFQNAYLREREKVAMYEQAWVEMSSVSSSS